MSYFFSSFFLKIIQSREEDEHVQEANEIEGHEDENAKILFCAPWRETLNLICVDSVL